MFEALAEAIDRLSVPPCGQAITEALALRNRLDSKISEAVGAFDAAGLWDLDAATSMTAWLRHHASLTKREAAHLSTRAKRLRSLPVTAAAWQSGEITGGQVDAVVANLRPEHLELFSEHEAELIPTLVGLSVTVTARAMAHWAAHAAALDDEAESPEPERSLHLSKTLDGAWALNGTLHPEAGDVVAVALRMGESPDSAAEPARTPAERRADALVDVCRFYLDHQFHHAAGRHRPHVNVVIDFEALQAGRAGQVIDGGVLDGPAIRALTCDSALHRVVMSGRSAVLDYGTSTRTIPATLWNALVVRDEHCRFPGCDRTSSWCEGHHVVHIADDGPTCLENLVLVCSRHHHRLHQPGWHAKLRPDASLEVTDPDGRHWCTAPPRAGPTLV
jgi:Domain of unknown function (DUF222)